jgi:hypothetical protein
MVRFRYNQIQAQEQLVDLQNNEKRKQEEIERRARELENESARVQELEPYVGCALRVHVKGKIPQSLMNTAVDFIIWSFGRLEGLFTNLSFYE